MTASVAGTVAGLQLAERGLTLHVGPALAWVTTLYPGPVAPGGDEAWLDRVDARWTLRLRGPHPRALANAVDGVGRYHRPPELRAGLRWRRTRLGAGDLLDGDVVHAHASPSRAWLDALRYPPEAVLDAAVAAAMLGQPRLQFLHGAVAARGPTTVVLTGVSGAGKSTLADDLHAAGWDVGGDETFALDPDAGTVVPVARPILTRTTGALPFSAPGHDTRRVSRRPAPWPSPRRLTHLVVLRTFGTTPRLEPGPPAALVAAALLDSAPIAASWGQDPARHALRFSRLFRALGAVTVAALDLGPRTANVEALSAWAER